MKPAPKKVGSVAVRPGKWTHGSLRVGLYPDGGPASIPLWVAAGPRVQPGKPTVIGAVVGGAHGNEPNGPELVNRVVGDIDPRELQGVLIVLPLMNPWGYQERMRMVPIDQRDLNRSYPGHAQGSFTFMVAHTIMQQVIQHCGFVVDCHDAGDRIVLVPHARAHNQPEDDASYELALTFGSEIVLLREAEPGMLAREARAAFGTTVVSLEIGGAMQVKEDQQERAKRGVFNMLRTQGLLSGQLVLPPHQHVLRSRHTAAAELSGIQTNYAALGQVVQKGEPLYRIEDPLTGQMHLRRSSTCGVVLAQNLSARIDKGDPSVSLLEFMSCDTNSLLKADIVQNRSDQHTVVLKGAQSWSHLRHHP